MSEAPSKRRDIPQIMMRLERSGMFLSISVLIGNGDGTFKPQVTYATGSAPTSLVVGDLKSNKGADLVVADQGSNEVSVLRGNGDGTFKTHVTYPTGTAPYRVTIGYFDADSGYDEANTNSSR